MADPLFDAVERAQLSDLLGEFGPEAPTLLAPWTTRDIAAHSSRTDMLPSLTPHRLRRAEHHAMALA